MKVTSSSWLFVVSMLAAPVGCTGSGSEPGTDRWEVLEEDEQERSGAARGRHRGWYASRWVEQAFQAVTDQRIFVLDATRLYAMVTVAIYDSVNGIDRACGAGRDHALVPPTGAPANASRPAAAMAAAHRVLVSLVPAQAATLDAAVAEVLAELGSGRRVERGLEWGVQVGDLVVALRAMDGTQAPLIMPGGTGPGVQRLDYDARFSIMAPFGIADVEAYQAPLPPELTSADYTASFVDARLVGTADGDPLRDEIATFWYGGLGSPGEGANWLQAAIVIADEYGVDRSLAATARLYALIGMATADGTAVTHDSKADYFTWRVVPAVREADIDGNPDTAADPAWLPRTGTGNLTGPEYTSGAASWAGAAAAILEHFFCGREVSFCFATDGAESPRCYTTPAEGADEAGRARVLQGSHFQFSVDEGLAQGRGIGDEIATTRLQRKHRGGDARGGCSW